MGEEGEVTSCDVTSRLLLLSSLVWAECIVLQITKYIYIRRKSLAMLGILICELYIQTFTNLIKCKPPSYEIYNFYGLALTLSQTIKPQKDMPRIEPKIYLEYYHHVLVLVFGFHKNKECNCLSCWESGKKESGHKNNTLRTKVQCVEMKMKTDIFSLNNSVKFGTPSKIMWTSSSQN